jgi:hypothetical protein
MGHGGLDRPEYGIPFAAVLPSRFRAYHFHDSKLIIITIINIAHESNFIKGILAIFSEFLGFGVRHLTGIVS